MLVTRLNYWRKKLGLTHDQLGERLGVTGVAASRYCYPLGKKGARRPSADSSARLPDATEGHVHAGNYAELVDPETGLTPAESEARAEEAS